MQRNDFCECRSQKPSKFCLCVEPRVLLCNSCKLQHLQDQDKEAFHDLYPYEMIEVYEHYGREGLGRRKAQLRAARSLLQSLKEAEASEYSRTVEALVEARHSIDLVHRSICELMTSTAALVQEALLVDVQLELEGFSSYVLSQGNRPQSPVLFTPLYNFQSVQILSKNFLRMTTESVEDLLLDLVTERKTEPSTTRLKKSLTNKGLGKDSVSRSAFLTPRRTSKPKLSPYKPSLLHSKSTSKRKSMCALDSRNSRLNSSSALLIAAYDRDESIIQSQEPLFEGYHSPLNPCKASGKNSRSGKPADEGLTESFDCGGALRKKNRSDVGVARKEGEEKYWDLIPAVLKKSAKLQRRVHKMHV